jgi:hypothetical protein
VTAPREFEIALIVRSEAPRQVADHVAALASVAEYRLLPHPSLPIHDRYFDTADGALTAGRVALRLRTAGESLLIAIKGPARRVEWGAVERLEFEAPWSGETLSKAIDVLQESGVVMPHRRVCRDAPVEVLRALGLDIIQDRETERMPRSVTRSDDTGASVIAELAVDAVAYHVGAAVVRTYEVEIEAKSVEGPRAVQAISESLVSQFAPALRPWPHGKLATGQTIERLYRDGSLRGLLGADNTLSPSTLDLIEASLAGESGGC